MMEKEEDRLIQLVEKAATALGEEFDAVQILVSWGADGGGTKSVFRGSGNWFARQGMAHNFILQDEAEEIAQTAKKVNLDETET
jgi:hypothetical protein